MVQIANAPTMTLATTMIAIIAVLPTLSLELVAAAAAIEAVAEAVVEAFVLDLVVEELTATAD